MHRHRHGTPEERRAAARFLAPDPAGRKSILRLVDAGFPPTVRNPVEIGPHRVLAGSWRGSRPVGAVAQLQTRTGGRKGGR
jgi:hypothetical protein